MKNYLRNERGFILMTTYMLASTLMIFSIALFVRGSVFVKSAERNHKKIVAFNAAEAGFDDAYYRLKNNTITSFPWTSGYVSLDSGNMKGGYSTTVTDMGSNIKRISVTGYSPSQSSSTEIFEQRALTGYASATSGSVGFNYGVFGRTSVTFTGNAQVDSYNSALGAYNTTSNRSTTSNAAATNSTSSGGMTLTGNATIYGNAQIGTGGSTSTVISTTGNALISGTKTAQSSNLSTPAATTSTASSGALSISGNTNYTLPAGTYNFSSLSITGNGRLTPTGAVRIYVSGTISIAGNGIATTSNTPTNLTLYSTGSSSVSLSGNGNFYGGIYAPNSTVSNTGNGQLYGAVVANVYNQTGNGNVHFDQALLANSSSSSTASMLSWQETNKAAADVTSNVTGVS